MTACCRIAVLVLAVCATLTALTAAAEVAAALPQRGVTPRAATPPARAIRSDLPLTKSIRRAFAVGTRDSSGRPGPKYWQLWTDYTIRARLDPATSTITGHERVILHNPSDSSLREIYLRLDQNLFTPTVQRRVDVMTPTKGMVVTRVTLNGQPLDSMTLDQWETRGVAHPPRPIVAKSTAVLEFEWHFEVPAEGLRMGRWGDTLYQVAQWYPRVAVYDDLNGWDNELYLGRSEFYNNFGHFDVELEVPTGWVVGATGMLQNPEAVLAPAIRERLAGVLTSDSTRTIVRPEERGAGTVTATGDRLVWHFVADSVTDFAWAASDRFVWEATRATIPGRGAIPVHVLYLSGDAGEFVDAPAIARRTLERYSAHWMPYAFAQLTMVDGPDQGMEYPMLIMSRVSAEDHEIGHQWWPMMVSNNETWYGWMDEGFNEYMAMATPLDSAAQASMPHPGDERRSVLDGQGQRYGETSGEEREPPLMWNANYAGTWYSFQAYTKAPLMLSMLGGIVGDSAVWRAMSDFAKAWRFKHPSPWDFAFFMNRALHQDLSWFWYYWLFTTESIDGSISHVTTHDARTTVTVRQDGQMPAPVVLQVRFAPKGPAIKRLPNSHMVDSVTAVVTYPVDVWVSGRRTFTAALDFGGRKIESITLDPRGRFPDRDTGDNVWNRPVAAGSH